MLRTELAQFELFPLIKVFALIDDLKKKTGNVIEIFFFNYHSNYN